MSAYTPGPWHVLPRQRVNRQGQPTYDIMAGSGHPENWDMVADRVDGEANARLIAAAPDLLEAAKHAAMEYRLHGALTDSCRVLEAAIAKAEGRQGE